MMMTMIWIIINMQRKVIFGDYHDLQLATKIKAKITSVKQLMSHPVNAMILRRRPRGSTPNDVFKWLTILLRIWEIPDSNLGPGDQLF
jgi:hypothetical protein